MKYELNTGDKVIIQAGEYELISFTAQDEGSWAHSGKMYKLNYALQGLLLQYVDHPEYVWNVFVEVEDSNGYNGYIIIAVEDKLLRKIR